MNLKIDDIKVKLYKRETGREDHKHHSLNSFQGG